MLVVVSLGGCGNGVFGLSLWGGVVQWVGIVVGLGWCISISPMTGMQRTSLLGLGVLSLSWFSCESDFARERAHQASESSDMLLSIFSSPIPPKK